MSKYYDPEGNVWFCKCCESWTDLYQGYNTKNNLCKGCEKNNDEKIKQIFDDITFLFLKKEKPKLKRKILTRLNTWEDDSGQYIFSKKNVRLFNNSPPWEEVFNITFEELQKEFEKLKSKYLKKVKENV